MFASTNTVSTTGVAVATSKGDASSPNQVLLKVVAACLVGSSESNAVALVESTDGWVPFNLMVGEDLWVKSVSSTVATYTIQSHTN
jgi:hypothetical protein